MRSDYMQSVQLLQECELSKPHLVGKYAPIKHSSLIPSYATELVVYTDKKTLLRCLIRVVILRAF